MAPTIEQIMDAIVTRLSTISGLNHYDYLPTQVTPPASITQLPSMINYHDTSARGKMALNITLLVVTSSTFDVTGQKQLSAFLDPTGAKSVVNAIESDYTLGGVVDYCIVKEVTVGGLESFGLNNYYGAAFQLEIRSSGA